VPAEKQQACAQEKEAPAHPALSLRTGVIFCTTAGAFACIRLRIEPNQGFPLLSLSVIVYFRHVKTKSVFRTYSRHPSCHFSEIQALIVQSI